MRVLFTQARVRALVGCAAAVGLALSAAPASAVPNVLPPDAPCKAELEVAAPNAAAVEAAYMCVYVHYLANKAKMTESSAFAFHEAMQDAIGLSLEPKFDFAGAMAGLIAAFDLPVPVGDSKALGDLLKKYPEAKDKVDYTDASWEPCGKAREVAEEVFAKRLDATQAQLDAAAADLTLKCDTLVKAPAGDKKALNDALVDADKLAKDLYTDESWADFAKARDEAHRVATDATASQARIDLTVKALKDAMAALKLKVNLDPKAAAVKVKAAQLTVTLVKGGKMTVPAFAYNGYNKASKVSFKSSKTKVATVNAKGKIVAKKVGKATVTATAPNGLKVTIKVKVVAEKPATAPNPKVTVKGVKKSMKVGGVAYANVTFKPKNAVGVKVTFKSLKKSVVAVDKAGRLVAKKKGKATLVFKAGSATKKITVTVK
ncbi:MAG: Ig-like domain-containing protein [Micrococcales bacterium]|nr:Ig-like domain-containing protein [Micrococcales bacterium]